ALRRTLARVGADNDQGEQYVTDVLALLVEEGAPVGGHRADDPGFREPSKPPRRPVATSSSAPPG
ncbi:UNVERIFIED_ORG: hypothetical protein E4P37_15505, partial [Bacillus sp. AZ43]